MDNGHVFYGYIDIYDEKVYTPKLQALWGLQLFESYIEIYKQLKGQLNPASKLLFYADQSLIDEAVIDAIIGLRKITKSDNNAVDEPNAFKIAAYLAYWWLRHKPVSIYDPVGNGVNSAKLSPLIVKDLDVKEAEHKTQVYRWKLKHINELVAVHFVSTYIFQFDKSLCGKTQENRVRRKMEEQHCVFAGFEPMKVEILDKLTYHFAYRALAPKVIEHILEAYTFHPAWMLTGNLWQGDEVKENIKENSEEDSDS